MHLTFGNGPKAAGGKGVKANDLSGARRLGMGPRRSQVCPSTCARSPVVLSTTRGCSHPLASCGILPICRRMTLKVVLHGVLPRKPIHGRGRREALLLRVHVRFLKKFFFLRGTQRDRHVSSRRCPDTGHGIDDAMATVSLRASTALQSAVLAL